MSIDLSKIEAQINKKLLMAMKRTEKIVYKELKQWIDLYYNEYSPKYYERINQMKDSFKSSGVTVDVDGISFKIGFDDDYITFHYPLSRFTGFDVLTAMESKTHGYTAVSLSPYAHWSEGLQAINAKYGSIGNILKEQLTSVGLKIY